MGAVFEVNWYLVSEDEKSYKKIQDNTYVLKKSEKRIYPVGFKIPLIIKKVGCIAEAKIDKIVIESNLTEIYFSIIEEYDKESDIAKHYYNKYLDFKNGTI